MANQSLFMRAYIGRMANLDDDTIPDFSEAMAILAEFAEELDTE